MVKKRIIVDLKNEIVLIENEQIKFSDLNFCQKKIVYDSLKSTHKKIEFLNKIDL